MAVVRWKVEMQHRYPSVETGLDYYWTSVYYYNNLNSDPTAGASYNALLDATYQGSTYDNRLVAIRRTDVEHAGTPTIATPADNHGTLPEVGGGSLINVLRLTGWAEGRPVSYHLWRTPLSLPDMAGMLLSDDYWSVVQDVIIPFLTAAELLNVRGDVIDTWTADRRIHMWQLRHGTNRRIGPVFAYP